MTASTPRVATAARRLVDEAVKGIKPRMVPVPGAAAGGALSTEAVEGTTLLTVPVPGTLLLAVPSRRKPSMAPRCIR